MVCGGVVLRRSSGGYQPRAKPEVRSAHISKCSKPRYPCTFFNASYSLMLGRWTHRLASSNSLFRPLLQECYSTSTHPRISQGDDLGPTRDDAHRTLRIRTAAKDAALPLPPLLDPVIREKRSRWEKAKLQPNTQNATPFQKKLLANPFGAYIAHLFLLKRR